MTCSPWDRGQAVDALVENWAPADWQPPAPDTDEPS